MKLNDVHEDARGSIKNITGFKNFEEAVLIETREGFARGGCIHTADEKLVVLEGRIELQLNIPILSPGRKNWCHLDAGESIIIPAAVAHYYRSLTDSIVMEWGPDKDGNERDLKMRAIVDAINEEKLCQT